MNRHKALLIGASDYDDPAITSLAFVGSDLRRMKNALTRRGFDAVEIATSKRGVTPNFVNSQVSDFLWRARRGDALLVVLSGHGLHFEGADYLVPEDAYLRAGAVDKSCIRIDWVKELEESAAEQIIFLIDACREGIDRDSMAPPPGVRQWSTRKVAASLRRKVAYVYACSPAQVALYVRETDVRATDEGHVPATEAFSLFSRAVSDSISDLALTDLHAFEEAIQRRIDDAHHAHGKKGSPQKVRVVADAEKSTFSILPRWWKSVPRIVVPESAQPVERGAMGSVSNARRSHTSSPTGSASLGVRPSSEKALDLRSPAHRTERELLKLALQKPGLVPEFGAYAEIEFTAPPYAAVYRCISAAGGVSTQRQDYLARVRDSAPNDKVRELLFELAVEPIHSRRADREYAGVQLAQVRLRSVHRRIEELHADLQRLEEVSHESTTELQAELWKLQQYGQELRRSGVSAL